MKKITAAIPFAGSQLDQTRHVCAFFNNADEEYRVLLPFIKDGFQSGHKAIHVVNPDHVKTTCNAWLRKGSTRPPCSGADSWSFALILTSIFRMAASIRIA